MKWRYYSLSDDDQRAKAQIFENLNLGAYEHTLTKKLLARFSAARGALMAIAMESLDLEGEWLFKYATYVGETESADAIGSQDIAWTDSPIWGLIEFVDRWLSGSTDRVTVCENCFLSRKVLIDSPRESRTSCYGEEVYHILTNQDASNQDAIECALRESEHHWATGVCSRYAAMPHGDIPSEAFFDEIVANTAHIFTPALDGEGYLVWSPERLNGTGP